VHLSQAKSGQRYLKFSVKDWLIEAEGDASPKACTPSINKNANSKLEIRNSKQFQMVKNQKLPNKPVSDFRNLDLRLWVCFGFRYSDFGICFAGISSAKFILSITEGLRTAWRGKIF
jgi:hypothetical protein